MMKLGRKMYSNSNIHGLYFTFRLINCALLTGNKLNTEKMEFILQSQSQSPFIMIVDDFVVTSDH